MELYDYLTQEDKDTIKDWLEINKQVVIPDLRQTLKYWNKNNRTMFKFLGGQLRYKVPIEIEMNKHMYYRKLDEIYREPHIGRYCFGQSAIDDLDHEFMIDFFNYYFYGLKVDYDKINKDFRSPIFFMYASYKTLRDTEIKYIGINSMFSHTTIGHGALAYDYTVAYKDKKPLNLKEGTKIAKAIQKFLKYVEYPHMELFEKWRNEISNLSTIAKIKANLVLSIHPIDFLTLSDNNSGWDSCVRMIHSNQGEYHEALTEMLNSNCTIVAYLESNHKKFIFDYHDIPNKTWRQIFYCHKDIICGGKSYPYCNDELTKKVLRIVAMLAEENLKWKYSFGPQLYKDVRANNGVVARNTEPPKDKHKILLYTYGYYNDFAADHWSPYWCMRNKVKKNKRINVSGPATCIVCGEKIIDHIYSYDEVDDIIDNYKGMVCEKCRRYYCWNCKVVDQSKIHYCLPSLFGYYFLCEDCIKDYMFYIRNKKPVFFPKEQRERLRIKEECYPAKDYNYEQYRVLSYSNSF